MDERLIEKVKNHSCLYNVQSHDYRDANARQTAWEEIGRELNIPGNVAKDSWDRLRRCFNNARNRRRGTDTIKKNVWRYEEQMAFLLPFIETRKTHSSLNERQFEPQGDVAGDWSDFETQQPEQASALFLEGNDETNEAAVENDDVQRLSTTSTWTTVDGSGRAETSQWKRRKESRPNTSTPPHHQIGVILKERTAFGKRKYEEKNTSQSLETLDDTDVFFLSMSRMTKQLSKLEQARIKLQLSNLVLSAEVRAQEQNQLTVEIDPQYFPRKTRYQSSPSPISQTCPTPMTSTPSSSDEIQSNLVITSVSQALKSDVLNEECSRNTISIKQNE